MSKNKVGLTMKLLIDTKSNRILYAEAGKDEVDFLFSLLGMPMGTVIKLITKDRMVGCLGRLYTSVERLDNKYLLPHHHKSLILSPKASAISGSCNPFIPPPPVQVKRYYYRCSGSCNKYFTDVLGTHCPGRWYTMSTMAYYVMDPNSVVEVGYVKDLVTYMVMDDLSVTPMSTNTMSYINLLDKFQVKDVGALQEKTVWLGLHEGVELLMASLQSNTVLTDVFFDKSWSELESESEEEPEPDVEP